MRAGRALRRLVIARIEAEVPELAARVYDKAPAGLAYPYASLGASYGTDASVICIRARTITLQIDVWHGATSKGACEDLVDDVVSALDGWADTAGLTMHPLAVSMIRVMDDPGGDVHGIVQIEAVIEADPV